MIPLTWPPIHASRAFDAAGTCLLVSAILIEITDGPLLPELALSLAGAAAYLVAAPLISSAGRVLVVVAAALASLVAVACLARITQQPLLNVLDAVPLLLVAYAASTRRSAMQRQRLLQRERGRARHDGEERERRRWARELHDDTLQELGAVQVVLSAATTDGHPEAMRSAIEQARVLVGNQITSLRHLIVDLRPAVLDELGLCPALEALCRRTTETFGVPVDLQIPRRDQRISDCLTPEAQAHVYRIVQEALTNAVKHGDPTQVTVGMETDHRSVTLTVADNGCGMPPSATVGRHSHQRAADDPSPRLQGVGLSAMHERADLIDAEIKFRSAPRAGTTVMLRVPVVRHGHSQTKNSAE
ncbi:sensor histidine kinase [Streptomyces sp. MMS24-I2-30]|uniref:sensor histidine kinase n=1 Tax=Streptomyces sp. MMS24-I2-30 TaxID=3351564 RepID=UPI003896908A